MSHRLQELLLEMELTVELLLQLVETPIQP